MSIIRRAQLAALSVAILAGSVPAAFAADVTFQMRNSHPNPGEL